jgi:threonine/homoserine/homoserine lactone efflux protein
MATSLLNPKAYLFTLAVYGGLVVASDRARAWFADRPTINRGLSRGVGVLLLATAVLTAYQGWQSGGALT